MTTKEKIIQTLELIDDDFESDLNNLLAYCEILARESAEQAAKRDYEIEQIIDLVIRPREGYNLTDENLEAIKSFMIGYVYGVAKNDRKNKNV